MKPVLLREELSIMTFSFVKWLICAAFAGLVVGAGASLFVWILNFATGLGDKAPGLWRLLLLPLGLLVSTWIVKTYAPSAKGHGTEKVIEAVHEKDSMIQVAVVPVKLVATVVTLACGGSAGKEGPAAQIGAGMMSIAARVLRFSSYDRMRLVVCGVSAGFAAIFGTPVAGALFGLEVLFVGQVFYDVLFASVVSGVVSWRVSAYCGVHHPDFAAALTNFEVTPNVMVWVIIAGFCFGLMALLYILTMQGAEKAFHRLPVSPYLKALIGAGLLILLALALGQNYLGLGMDTVEGLILGQVSWTRALYFAFFCKMVFTSITLSCGGSGGVVTPIFFIGVTGGAAFAHFFQLPVEPFAALGMVSLLAACANAPVSAVLMGLELFGAHMAPAIGLSCIAAFLVVGHHSIYPSQKLARSKFSVIRLANADRIDRVQTTSQWTESRTLHRVARFNRANKMAWMKSHKKERSE